MRFLKTYLFLLFQKLEGLRPKLPPGRLAVTASLTRNRDKSRRYLFTKNRIVCQSSCYAGGFFKGENPFGLRTTLWSHTSEFRQILRPTKMSWLNLSKNTVKKQVFPKNIDPSQYSKDRQFLSDVRVSNHEIGA